MESITAKTAINALESVIATVLSQLFKIYENFL